MAAASPEFYKPSAAPAYSPGRLLLAAATEPSMEDDYYCCCRTPTGAGISYLGEPATCPPAPRKPRPPPASTCRKRLFAADVITLRFDDLESIFRPSPLCDAKGGKDRRRRSSTDKLSTRRSVGGGAILS